MEKLNQIMKEYSDLKSHYISTKNRLIEDFEKNFYEKLLSLKDICNISLKEDDSCCLVISCDIGDGKFNLDLDVKISHDNIKLDVEFKNLVNVKNVPKYPGPSDFSLFFCYDEISNLISFSKILIKFLVEIYNRGDYLVHFSPSYFDVYFSSLDKIKSMYIYDDEWDEDENDDYNDDDCIFGTNNSWFNYVEGFDGLLETILERYKSGYYLKLKGDLCD